ncbi:MAG: MFS transporter [Pseudomonadales bacterium]|nr:MFS transporter [Pseudomonadales bacterium]
MNNALRWYLTSTGCYLIPGGIQQVLFPWLVAVYLAETPERLGFAQMASQLPMVVLILWGGLIGDRLDQRKLLIGLQLALAVPPLVMAVFTFNNLVFYEMLVIWVFIAGTLGAFNQPARDALLNRVAGPDIQRVVTLSVGIQFGVQIFGFLLGSTAEKFGPTLLLVTQSSLMIMAAALTARIPPLPPLPERPRRHPLREIQEGLVIALSSKVIRPAIILTMSVGIFFAGAYMVLLPLIVRDVYGGGAQGIALAFACNMLGTVTTIIVMMKMGGINRPGRAMITVGCISSCILFCLQFGMPAWAFYAVVYLWGMCGGISMTMSRAVVQEAAPETHRARIMSVYSLGMMGGMPIGSVILGWAAGTFGAREAVLIPSLGMLAVIAYLRLGTDMWHFTRQQQIPAEPAAETATESVG